MRSSYGMSIGNCSDRSLLMAREA